MNKLLVIGLICLLLIGCIGLYYFNQPNYSVEIIKPQILCYGGGC